MTVVTYNSHNYLYCFEFAWVKSAPKNSTINYSQTFDEVSRRININFYCIIFVPSPVTSVNIVPKFPCGSSWTRQATDTKHQHMLYDCTVQTALILIFTIDYHLRFLEHSQLKISPDDATEYIKLEPWLFVPCYITGKTFG